MALQAKMRLDLCKGNVICIWANVLYDVVTNASTSACTIHVTCSVVYIKLIIGKTIIKPQNNDTNSVNILDVALHQKDHIDESYHV